MRLSPFSMFLGFLMCLGVLLVSTALAQTHSGTDPAVPAVNQMSDFLWALSSSALAILVPWAVGKGLSWFEKKTKIDIPSREEKLVEDLIRGGLNLAEERAHQAKSGGDKMGKDKKRDTAVDFAWEAIQRAGLDKWTKDMIDKKMHAMLGASRAAGHK